MLSRALREALRALGRALSVTLTIVACLGAAFDLWAPLGARPTLVASDAGLLESRSYRWLDITGRRRPERTHSQAQEEFTAIAQYMANSHAESRGRTIDVVPLDTGTVQQLRPLFLSLLALSSVVLMVVCSNVANLLLVRGASRVREIAIRLALGATRAQVLSKLMLENATLAGAGAVVGLALTIVGRRALIRLTPQTNIPLNLETPVDFGVLAFLVVLGSATVLLFGLTDRTLQPTEAGGIIELARLNRPVVCRQDE
jgi:hypothetical protein